MIVLTRRREMLRRIVPILSLLVCVGVAHRTYAQAPGAGQPTSGKTDDTRAVWLARLNKIAPNDFRTAYQTTNELVAIPPQEAAQLIRSLWPDLTSLAVKAKTIDAFLNARHPDALVIASLGLADKDAQVQKAAVASLQYSLLGMKPKGEDASAYSAYLAANRNKTLDDLQKMRVSDLLAQLKTATGPAFAESMQTLASAGRSDILKPLVLQGDLWGVLQKRLAQPNNGDEIWQVVGQMASTYPPPVVVVKSLFVPAALHGQSEKQRITGFQVLATVGYAPAYAPLKKALAQSVAAGTSTITFQLAQALVKYGRPDAVPFCIGLIASDNTYDTVYWVGYFGLSPLTGVGYIPMHDGNWWRLWWERHHDEFPESARKMPILTFPRTAKYQEPIPNDLHLDRKRLYQRLLADLIRITQDGNPNNFPQVDNLLEVAPGAVIPQAIGLIASDNSYKTNYWIGGFLLSPLTGVPYSGLHDGNWWRLWWETHKSELPAEVASLPIPDYPRTKTYQEPIPTEVHRDPARLREFLLQRLSLSVKNGNQQIYQLPTMLVSLGDPGAIRSLIDLLPTETKTDKQQEQMYYLDYFALSRLASVSYDKAHDRAFWEKWWVDNRADVEKRIATFKPEPDYKTALYKPAAIRNPYQPIEQIVYAPQVKPLADSTVAGSQQTNSQAEPEPEDIRDVPSQRIALQKDEKRVYRLVGLKAAQAPPANGYALMVILPGGDGSEGFQQFIRRIKKFMLPSTMLAVQVIAPQWDNWQAQNLVWPTRKSPYFAMKFSTEQFIEDVITDVKRRTKIDPKAIYTLAWSSSGPAVYTYLATPGISSTGAFIAMSVFRPNQLPDPSQLKGKRVFLLHSPQDFIPIAQAKEAEQFLKEHGAEVQLAQYEGGHGWQGTAYPTIRTGVQWLLQPTNASQNP